MQLSRDVASVTFRFLYHEHKFIILCSRNNVQELRKWVALRAPIFKNKTILKLCFQDACKDGRVHIVRLLFRFFLSVDDMRANNNTAFRYACFYGHFVIVELLSRFLTVNDMRAENNYAFRWVCYNGHFKIVKFLSRFLTVDDMRANNNEAFQKAYIHGHIAIVEFLSRFFD